MDHLKETINEKTSDMAYGRGNAALAVVTRFSAGKTGDRLRAYEIVVEMLLKAQADPEQKNEEGKGALLEALAAGAPPSIVRLLLAVTNPLQKDFEGCMPLHYAAFYGNPYHVRALLQHYRVRENLERGDIEGITPYGCTQLEDSRDIRKGEVAALLVEEINNQQLETREGETKLKLAWKDPFLFLSLREF